MEKKCKKWKRVMEFVNGNVELELVMETGNRNGEWERGLGMLSGNEEWVPNGS